jgi:DNA-binding NarL/FixJ family response regulator
MMGHPNQIQLLVIDEHPAVRRALALRLGSAAAIQVVGTADQISNLDIWHPDVVLLGLRSHHHSPQQAARVVRALVRQGAAVIILSPYADELEREQLLHAGACRYLLKNINTPELISEIEDVSATYGQNGHH